MEWGWILGGVIAFALFGMMKTARRNKDPINHHLLSLLFSAASVTDDILSERYEMQQFMNELRKMERLDGKVKTVDKLAHVASMIPHYGSASPLVQSRAKSIVSRIMRNGFQSVDINPSYVHNSKDNQEIKLTSISQKTIASKLPLFDDAALREDFEKQGFTADNVYRDIFEKFIKYELKDFKQEVWLDSKVRLILMRRAAPKKNQKKAPMLRVERWAVDKVNLRTFMPSTDNADLDDVIEVRDFSAFSLIENKPVDEMPPSAMRALLVLSLFKLNNFSVEGDVTQYSTPFCFALYDKGSEKLAFFATRCVNGQSKSIWGEMRDFSRLM